MLKQNVLNKITLLCVFLFLTCQNGEQAKVNPVKINSPVTIANSEQFTLYSSNIQQDYKIYIHLPESYSRSDTSYPVFYELDADICFGISSEVSRLLSRRKEMPEVILVGIAYGAYSGQEGNNRGRDYSPTAIAGSPTSGGAENFLRFIRDELIPLIDSKYRTNPIDRTLSGASFGGLFSLYVLFEHPGIFNRYKISSPNLRWDNGVIFEYEKKYSEKHSDLPANVFLSVGDVEQRIKAWNKLVQTLENRNYKNLKLTTMIYDDAPHGTACILAGVRGIKAVFSDD